MNIVVIGFGVIGGLFIMVLKEVGFENVYGIDINEELLEKVKKFGLIKEGFINGEEIIKDVDLIIIFLYFRLVK